MAKFLRFKYLLQKTFTKFEDSFSIPIPPSKRNSLVLLYCPLAPKSSRHKKFLPAERGFHPSPGLIREAEEAIL